MNDLSTSASTMTHADAGRLPPGESRLARISRRLANSRLGIGALSFGESTVLPIPLEAIMVPLMVGYPRRAWGIALSALIGCLIGSSLFFALGNLLFEPVVQPLLAHFGMTQSYETTVARLSEGSGYFWAIFLISLGPAPLQLATLGAGASEQSFFIFLLAIAMSRAIRYFGTALACALLGERVRRYHLPKWVLFGGSLLFLAVCWGVFALLV